MRAKLLTLRFSPTLGRFDDAALVSLQQKVVLEHLHEHLVTVGDESMLLCLATWRERTTATADGTRPTTITASESASPASSPAADLPSPAANDGAAERPRGPAPPIAELRAELTDDQRALFDRVRRWRRQKAHDEGLPDYVILTNRQLVEVARQRPRSRAALAQIRGLGDKKLARHGQEILAILWPDAPSDEPSPKVDLAVEAAS